MKRDARPVANPVVVLREEFDDWAVLFDPDTGDAFGLNPTGVIVWKHLDGSHTADDLLDVIRSSCTDVPETAKDEIMELLESLVEKGLAGFRLEKNP